MCESAGCEDDTDCDAGHFCLDGECRFAGSVKDTGDPSERACNPPSYTDLGNGIVRDNVTGLQWVQDGNLMASRNPVFDTDGTAGDGAVTWQHALDYISLLNADEYLGCSDWRLPTIKELPILVDAGQSSPAIDPAFSNTAASAYWSSTSFQIFSGMSWTVDFNTREVLTESKESTLYVFAVRGGPHAVSDSFVVNGDGTVTDANTDLMWQQCNHWQIWDENTATCIGNPEPPDWRQPFEYIKGLNTAGYLGHSDWRLPTVNELLSLIDYSLSNPASTFPMTGFWWEDAYTSSTSFSDRYVGFYTGHVVGFIDSPPCVRAVRGGECLAASTGCLDDSDCDDGLFCNGRDECLEGECIHVWEGACDGHKYPICDEENDTCVDCLADSDCDRYEGSGDLECVDNWCQFVDISPVIGDGPFVAAGWWPLLSSTAESPTVFNQNRNVLWTFSDDFASCDEGCTHAAEYQVVGRDTWTSLTVSSDTEQGYAWVELPIDQLTNATTHAFRFTVTDCAGQTTESGIYYFRVATSDAPPVIGDGPLLTDRWQVMPVSSSRATLLDQDTGVLWTFDDDYASCAGLCTHRARYRRVGDTNWTWVIPETDPTGKWYAYTPLPAASLEPGDYMFQFDVRDCAGQYRFPPHYYYFTVPE